MGLGTGASSLRPKHAIFVGVPQRPWVCRRISVDKPTTIGGGLRDVRCRQCLYATAAARNGHRRHEQNPKMGPLCSFNSGTTATATSWQIPGREHGISRAGVASSSDFCSVTVPDFLGSAQLVVTPPLHVSEPTGCCYTALPPVQPSPTSFQVPPAS